MRGRAPHISHEHCTCTRATPRQNTSRNQPGVTMLLKCSGSAVMAWPCFFLDPTHLLKQAQGAAQQCDYPLQVSRLLLLQQGSEAHCRKQRQQRSTAGGKLRGRRLQFGPQGAERRT